MKYLSRCMVFAICIALSGGISVAQDLSYGWTVHGDATVVYRANAHAIAHHVVIPESSRQRLAVFYRDQAKQQNVRVSDAQVSQFVKQQVTGSEAPVNTTPFSFLLTESAYNQSFLYKLVTDKVNQSKVNFASRVTIYDGHQTTSSWIPTKDHPASEVHIDDGLTGRLLTPFPLYCAGLAGIKFIKDVVPLSGGKFQAQILHSEGGGGPIPFYPCVIDTHKSATGPQISHISVTTADHIKRMDLTFTGSVINGFTEIPQQIHEVLYDPSNGDAPTWECDYRLQSSTNKSVNPDAFRVYSILNPLSQIRTKLHGKDVVVAGYRSNMSLADQEERAYLEQQTMNQLPQPKHNVSGLYLLIAFILILGASYIRRRKMRA